MAALHAPVATDILLGAYFLVVAPNPYARRDGED